MKFVIEADMEDLTLLQAIVDTVEVRAAVAQRIGDMKRHDWYSDHRHQNLVESVRSIRPLAELHG